MSGGMGSRDPHSSPECLLAATGDWANPGPSADPVKPKSSMVRKTLDPLQSGWQCRAQSLAPAVWHSWGLRRIQLSIRQHSGGKSPLRSPPLSSKGGLASVGHPIAISDPSGVGSRDEGGPWAAPKGPTKPGRAPTSPAEALPPSQ